MRILYHHRIASKDGQHVHVQEIVTALRALGHEVYVVSPAISESQAFSTEGGYVSWLKHHIPRFVYESLEFGYSFWVVVKLLVAVWRHRPEVIYERYNLFLPAGIWVARLCRVPLILEINAPLFDERGRYDGIALKLLARWSERYCWRNADAVLPVTDVLAERIVDEGVLKERIHVVPNGINEFDFAKVPDTQDAQKLLRIRANVVLGFTGYVRAWHGLDRVVDMIADNVDQDWHLLIVGDGPARVDIENRASERGVSDKVTITGVVARSDILAHISAFDIALQPDVVPYASPLKLFEYLGVGRAIVAPDTPNIREVLEDGINGLLFDPDDEDDFFRKIEKLCADRKLQEKLKANARQLIQIRGYTWMSNARRIVALAESLKADKARNDTNV